MIEQFLESNTKGIVIMLCILGFLLIMAVGGFTVLSGLHIGGLFGNG